MAEYKDISMFDVAVIFDESMQTSQVKATRDYIEKTQYFLNKLPSIVTCKDCEYWNKCENSAQGRCELLGISPTGGWYCANGERRKRR